ncbi:hypothetical protein MGI18_05210 [Bacillus sp. OVS6]|nr:hypothetical protein MGI18_05210 [Bacillus sp. OVS6]
MLQLETSFALNIKETSIMNVEFCGDQAGATLYPAQIYTDEGGELVSLLKEKSLMQTGIKKACVLLLINV